MKPAIDPVFEPALRFTLDQECRGSADEKLLNEGITGQRGALVDHPADKGGRTAYGITQKTYDVWREEHGLKWRDVWLIEAQEVVDIYAARYWAYLPAHCAPKLAIAVFDTAVLHGKTYAAKRLQVVLALTPDGQVGPKTLAAVRALPPGGVQPVLRAFLQARDDRYEQLVAADGSQVVFFAGWEARCDKLCDLVGIPRTVDPGRAAA